jgi:hypothetical protein
MAEKMKEKEIVTRPAQKMFTIRAAALVAVIAAALLVPAAASAQSCATTGGDPSASQYCSVAGVNTSGGNANNSPTSETRPVVAESPAPTVAAVESPAESGSLPFTGLDVGILALVAAALAGTGLLLRRLTAFGEPRS